MRLSGILRSWNDDRGFGFIAPTHGSAELFVHISSLPRDGTRPTVGEKLTYELGRGKDGRPQAVNVIRQAIVETPRRANHYIPKRNRETRSLSKIIGLLIVVAIGVYGYKHYEQRIPPYATIERPISTAPEQTAKRDTEPTEFRCDGRAHCSQMTSCTEAKFFLKNCPGTQMDGNNDGVPCEQQWCTGMFAK